MKTTLDCIPCLLRQALDVITLSVDDPLRREHLLRDVLQEVSGLDFELTPPHIARHLHRMLRQASGIQDPYKAVKERFNRLALDMVPGLAVKVNTADDPLAMAVRLAIAGNVIDLGVNNALTVSQARQVIGNVLAEPFCSDMDAFRHAAATAGRILYLTDNSGEIVFDRLLIEQLPPAAVTVAVRGFPVINDATMEDARLAGLDQMAEVMDNGSDAPGTILQECSAAFLERAAAADMIIAKGQGNFETLAGVPGPIFFLFKVKCPVVADHVQKEAGSHMLLRSPLFEPQLAIPDPNGP